MYVLSLDKVSMLGVPLYRHRRSSRERFDGVGRCHNHRATSGDTIVEIHVRSMSSRNERQPNKGKIITV